MQSRTKVLQWLLCEPQKPIAQHCKCMAHCLTLSLCPVTRWTLWLVLMCISAAVQRCREARLVGRGSILPLPLTRYMHPCASSGQAPVHHAVKPLCTSQSGASSSQALVHHLVKPWCIIPSSPGASPNHHSIELLQMHDLLLNSG